MQVYSLTRHVHKRRARVRSVLLRILAQRPDPADPPLQPHLLRTLPRENVQDGRYHPQRLLPSVPLDHLHPNQPGPARGPVGQHWDLGPNCRGAAGEEGFGGWHKDPTQVNTVSKQPQWRLHVYKGNSLQFNFSTIIYTSLILNKSPLSLISSYSRQSGFMQALQQLFSCVLLQGQRYWQLKDALKKPKRPVCVELQSGF